MIGAFGVLLTLGGLFSIVSGCIALVGNAGWGIFAQFEVAGIVVFGIGLLLIWVEARMYE